MRVNGTRLSSGVARASQLEEQIRREVAQEVKQATARAREEQARKAQEAARVAEDAALVQEKAPAAGALARPGGAPFAMEDLMYPGAAVSKRIAAGTQAEISSMSTSDDIAAVKEFYVARIGAPQLAQKARLVFNRTEKGVNALVKVGPGGAGKKQLLITIVRTVSSRSR